MCFNLLNTYKKLCTLTINYFKDKETENLIRYMEIDASDNTLELILILEDFDIPYSNYEQYIPAKKIYE